MKPTGYCLIFFSLLLATRALAARTITLNEAVDLSLRFNPVIEIAGLNRLTQKFALSVVKNQYEWQYAFNASSQYTWNKNTSDTASGQNHLLQPSATRYLASGAQVSIAMNNALLNPNGSHNPTQYSPGVSVNISQPLIRGFGSAITLSPLADALDK